MCANSDENITSTSVWCGLVHSVSFFRCVRACSPLENYMLPFLYMRFKSYKQKRKNLKTKPKILFHDQSNIEKNIQKNAIYKNVKTGLWEVIGLSCLNNHPIHNYRALLV